MTCHIVNNYTILPQYASWCAFLGWQDHYTNSCIDCIGAVFPRCASWYVLWGWKTCCMKSCTVCTCAVSPLSEWGSGSSNDYSDQMTCYTVDNYIFWSQCEFAGAWKGFFYLRRSSGTHHKNIAETSSITKSSSVWRSFPIDLNHLEKNWITWPLLLSPKLFLYLN